MVTMDYFYSIRMRLHHPSMSPGEISNYLNIDPINSWSKIKGNGVIENYWNFSSYTKKKRDFFSEIDQILDWLILEKRDFIDKFIFTKGTFELIVQLSGKINMGSILAKETMEKASVLGVVIGIEVFPEMSCPSDD